jgi:hypothetical protein
VSKRVPGLSRQPEVAPSRTDSIGDALDVQRSWSEREILEEIDRKVGETVLSSLGLQTQAC